MAAMFTDLSDGRKLLIFSPTVAFSNYKNSVKLLVKYFSILEKVN